MKRHIQINRWLSAFVCLLSLVLMAFAGISTEDKIEEIKQPSLEVIGEEDDINRSIIEMKQSDAPSDVTLYRSDHFPHLKKEYTVMVYMIGSDMESDNSVGTKDLEEMERAGIDFSKVNLLVYTGGTEHWGSDIPNNCNCVLDMSKRRSNRIVARTKESANMGASETFASFLQFGTKYYPANHYGLICWDHGGGPLWGYGEDELSQGDSLLLTEMRSAMESTSFSREDRLDFVGFDACLMGSIEVAKAWSPYAYYMISSEEVEAGAGWDYSFLESLNSNSKPVDISRAIVKSYYDYYNKHKSNYSNPELTLSVLDLSELEALQKNIDQLAMKLLDLTNHGKYKYISKKRNDSKMFGLRAVDSRGEGYDLIDIGDLSEHFQDTCPKEAKAIKAALKKVVVENSSNVRQANGVSIYFPGDNKALYRQMIETKSEGTILSSAYQKFISVYSAKWMDDSTTIDWKFKKFEDSENEYILQLTDEQTDSMVEASFSILRHQPDGDGYLLASCDNILKVDEKNRLHIPKNLFMFTAVTGNDFKEDTGIPFIFSQIEDNPDGKKFKSNRIALAPCVEIAQTDTSIMQMGAVTLNLKEGEERPVIETISTNDGTTQLQGKNEIEVARYKDIINMFHKNIIPTADKNGGMKPYKEWDEGTWWGYDYENIENTIRFKSKNLSEFEGDYVCQVTVKDSSGVYHGSELIPMGSGMKAEKVSCKTEKGEMKFLVNKDEAELISYDGEDKVLNIPAKINDKPVTVIGNGVIQSAEELTSIVLPDTVRKLSANAFSSAYNVKEIKLNQGLKRIGAFSLSFTKIETITLPASVTSVAGCAFASMDNLESIEVDDENSVYHAEKGLLYTKNRKELVAYPAAKEGDYYMPDSVEVIGYGACYEAKMKKVVFAKNLKKIDNAAFYGCGETLSEINLPESVTYIGSLAFGGDVGESLVKLDRRKMPRIPVVHIGSRVSYIGPKAFNGLMIERLDVSEKNPFYSSVDIFLTDKRRMTILQAPMGAKDCIEIPEGITTIVEGVFENYPQHMKYKLPDSLYRLPKPELLLSYKMDEKGNRKFYGKLFCNRGSAVVDYAKKYDLTYGDYSEINKKDSIPNRKKKFLKTVTGMERYTIRKTMEMEAEHVYVAHDFVVKREKEKIDIYTPEGKHIVNSNTGIYGTLGEDFFEIKEKDNDNGFSLYNRDGEKLLSDVADFEWINDPCVDSEVSDGHYLKVYIREEETSNRDEALLYSNKNGYVSTSDAEVVKMYKADLRIYDVLKKKFIDNLSCTKEQTWTKCGKSLLRVENGITTLISEDGKEMFHTDYETDQGYGFIIIKPRDPNEEKQIINDKGEKIYSTYNEIESLGKSNQIIPGACMDSCKYVVEHLNDYDICIDAHGTQVLNGFYSEIKEEAGGFFAVRQGKNWSIVDSEGKRVPLDIDLGEFINLNMDIPGYYSVKSEEEPISTHKDDQYELYSDNGSIITLSGEAAYEPEYRLDFRFIKDNRYLTVNKGIYEFPVHKDDNTVNAGKYQNYCCYPGLLIDCNPDTKKWSLIDLLEGEILLSDYDEISYFGEMVYGIKNEKIEIYKWSREKVKR